MTFLPYPYESKNLTPSPEPSGIISDPITYEQPPWADEVNRPDNTPSEPSNATLREQAALALRATGIPLNNEQHAPNETQEIELTERQRREFEGDIERIIYEAHAVLREQRRALCKGVLPSYYGSTVLSATGKDENGEHELAYYDLYRGHEIILTTTHRDPHPEAKQQKLLIFKTGYSTESIVIGVVPLSSVTPEEVRQIVTLLRTTTFTNPRIDTLPTLF